MHRIALLLASSLLLATAAKAGPAEDAAAMVSSVLDKFDAGDSEAFFAAHQDGAVIVDEFAPYVWGGPNSARRWAAAYDQDSKKRGISGGRVDHTAPIQAVSDGSSAYVVLPTTYRFNQDGRKMAGKGSMTFVMTRSGSAWKIASWTYSGATAAPE